jgi:predicted nucleotidyltransferase
MRLDEKTRMIIKNEVFRELGDKAVIHLFGSRADDTKRGGDIDLLIEPPVAVPNRIHAECRLAAALSIKLGGCRVDVLIKHETAVPPLIYAHAISEGIIL